jgi:hypothetical protein
VASFQDGSTEHHLTGSPEDVTVYGWAYAGDDFIAGTTSVYSSCEKPSASSGFVAVRGTPATSPRGAGESLGHKVVDVMTAKWTDVVDSMQQAAKTTPPNALADAFFGEYKTAVMNSANLLIRSGDSAMERAGTDWLNYMNAEGFGKAKLTLRTDSAALFSFFDRGYFGLDKKPIDKYPWPGETTAPKDKDVKFNLFTPQVKLRPLSITQIYASALKLDIEPQSYLGGADLSWIYANSENSFKSKLSLGFDFAREPAYILGAVKGGWEFQYEKFKAGVGVSYKTPNGKFRDLAVMISATLSFGGK